MEVTAFHQRVYEQLKQWMGIESKVVAVDLHLGYTTSRIAQEMKEKIVPVQHHHAHMFSCMADRGLTEPCFGIILDGTGYCEDGHIWGFEMLYGDAAAYRRIAHLLYTPLPGGEKVIQEPWRNAVGMLYCLFGEKGFEWSQALFPEKQKEIPILVQMVEKGIHSPLARTCGRLFDAVSAILGLCHLSTYDGEAAIRLSEPIRNKEWGPDGYSFELKKGPSPDQPMILDMRTGIKELIEDHFNRLPLKRIIRRFHQMIVSACKEAVITAWKDRPLLGKRVVLSGGSFQNPFLSANLGRELREAGFEVFTHNRVPCNDGGLALGQLTVAAAKEMKD